MEAASPEILNWLLASAALYLSLKCYFDLAGYAKRKVAESKRRKGR